MNRAKIGLGILVLGLAAFVVGAQAETGARWRVSGADVGTLEPKLKVTELDNTTTSLSFTTKSGTAVLVRCSLAEVAEGGKLLGSGTISLGRVLFQGCNVLLNEVVTIKCEAKSPGLPNGQILTQRATGLIVLDTLPGGAVAELVKFTPEDLKGQVSKLLAIIELGTGCSIGESINVETTELGEGFWVKDSAGNAGFLTEETIHLFLEGLNKILAMGRPATMTSGVKLGLEGMHAGLNWSGLPA